MEQQDGVDAKKNLRELAKQFQFNPKNLEISLKVLNSLEKNPESLARWVASLLKNVKRESFEPRLVIRNWDTEVEVIGIIFSLLYQSKMNSESSESYNVNLLEVQVELVTQFQRRNHLTDLFTSDFYFDAGDLYVFFHLRKDRSEYLDFDDLYETNDVKRYLSILKAMDHFKLFNSRSNFEHIYQNIMLMKHLLYIFQLEVFFKINIIDITPEVILEIANFLSKIEKMLYGCTEIKTLLRQVFSKEELKLNKEELNNIATSFTYTSDTVLLQYLFHETTIAIEDELKTENRELLLYFAQKLNINIDSDFLPDTIYNYGELDGEDDDNDEIFPEEISNSKTLLNYAQQKESQDQLF